MNSALMVKNVNKAFGSKVVLKDLNFEANEGEFIVLVGPSGCGKSTMLRAIAGLETINNGSIHIEDKDVTALVPKDRDIAMVFQDYALYPHKNVYENIAFGLRLRKYPDKEIDTRVREVAEKLDLSDLLTRKPLQLSGGQRQRVAIGRAIVRKPKIFLFDEPLSNLDAKLRSSMRLTIARLQKELATTAVYVTHDQTEAMTLADRIIVLNDGIIQQIGSPLDLYYHPSNMFVGTFIGSPEMNLVDGKLEITKNSETSFISDNGRINLPIRQDLASKIKKDVKSNQKVVWGLRPENFRVPKPDANLNPVFTTDLKVIVSEPLGPSTLALCDFNGHELRISLPEPHRPKRGDIVKLEWRSRHLYLFDKETGEALINY